MAEACFFIKNGGANTYKESADEKQANEDETKGENNKQSLVGDQQTSDKTPKITPTQGNNFNQTQPVQPGGGGTNNRQNKQPGIGDKVMDPVSGWNAIWSKLIGERSYGPYEVDDNGNISYLKPITGAPDLIVGIGKIYTVTKIGVAVIGKFPYYLELAEKIGASRFNIPIEIWNRMNKAEQWAANVKYLDRVIARGDKIILSERVTDINKITGDFRKELDYLISKGYKLSSDGLQMIK